MIGVRLERCGRYNRSSIVGPPSTRKVLVRNVNCVGKQLVDQCHDSEPMVRTWTANNGAESAAMIATGVDRTASEFPYVVLSTIKPRQT